MKTTLMNLANEVEHLFNEKSGYVTGTCVDKSKSRAAFVYLASIEGYEPQEIADFIGRSLSSAYAMKHRAVEFSNKNDAYHMKIKELM